MSVDPIVLSGRYQLETVIGRGGMAEVWRARDLRLDRPVAIKRLRVDLATDSTFQMRFQREAQAAAGLNHPNIVSVYDTGEKIDPASGVSVPYIVMELVEGQTLRDLLRQGRPIEPQRAFEYEIGVLDALSYSHKHDIVHRDIKPANVMLTNGGQIKVMDFGIARAVSDTSATMTQTAAVIGTAQYLSPEQARGEQVDARSDIYSAGCLLYELLTGRPPFVGDSPVSVAYQHVREMPIPPSQLDPEITPDMDAITMKALAKRTDDRYQSAKEMRDDCWRLLNGQIVTAQAPAAAISETRSEMPTRALPAGLDPDYDPADEAAIETFESHLVEADGSELDKPKRKMSPATGVTIGLLILLLGILGFFTWRVVGSNSEDNNVQVPSVLGHLEDVAKEQLKTAQLTPEVVRVSGPAEGKGTVTAQDPPGGQTVLVGSTVKITVNDGPPVSEVPASVVGKLQDEAITVLKQAGFTNVEPLPAPSNLDTVGARKNEVVAISPGEGEMVPTDQKITIYVASGRLTVPDTIIGMPDVDARALLQQAGFTNVSSDYLKAGDSDEPVSYVRGQVVYSEPAVGSPLDSGSRIMLWLASGESEMPNLIGLTQDDAESELEKHGFENVNFVNGDDHHSWVVTAQSVPANTVRERSVEITVTLGRSPTSPSSPSTAPSSSSSSPTADR